MPDSVQEKTEAPTLRRREEARREGQVARSTDLAAAVVLLGSLLMLYLMGRGILGELLACVRFCLGDTSGAAADRDQMVQTLGSSMQVLGSIVLPVLLVVFALALLSAVAQVGFLLTARPIMPRLGKLNPIKGLKRMFSARSFVVLLMGMAKTTLLVIVAWWTLAPRIDVFAQASAMHHLSVIAVSSELFFTLGLRLAICLLLLAILDYAYQRYKTEQELKMTKEEIRDELKNMEGDPKLRHRRRQVQLQMALHRIQAAVPKADVIVTNPTELAIAIQYDSATMNAPRVVAKGADHMARRIREIAMANGVPIVERKPLARALYKQVDVGQEIPVQFYKAIAEILAYVYELSGRRAGRHVSPRPALN